jgi:calnexin
MIDNPLHKGKWVRPKIPNPEYKGVWTPRQIENPTYFSHENPVDHLTPMTALAVEVWTTNSGVHFDNFIVTDSKEELQKFTTKTYQVKREAEGKALKDEEKEARQKERERVFASGTSQEKLRAMITYVIEYFGENPLIAAATALAIVVPFFYILFFGGQNPSVDVDGNPVKPDEMKEEDATEEKDENEEEDKEEEEEEKEDKKKTDKKK